MAPTKPVTIDFTALRDAYEFANIGGFGENMAYLSLDTGKIHLVSDLLDMEDEEEVPDDVEISDRYLAIPHKNELDLGRELVLRFTALDLPGDLDTVEDMFRRKGAYQNFKYLLGERDVLQKWYDFEARETEEALREWCEDYGIKVVG
jgi:hypothetical protein